MRAKFRRFQVIRCLRNAVEAIVADRPIVGQDSAELNQLAAIAVKAGLTKAQ